MHHLNDQHHSLLLPLLCSEVPPSLSVLLCMLLLPFMSILPCRPLSLTYHCDECFLMFPHRQDWPKWCATLATIRLMVSIFPKFTMYNLCSMGHNAQL